MQKDEMKTVSFINMADGTAQDYALLEKYEEEFAKGLPERILHALTKLEDSFSGYRISRLEHSLQAATRAHRDGREVEYVVTALVHDIGDELAPFSHSEMVAAILRPYVSEKLYWIVKHHGIFQMYYYAHHIGGDRHARERFKDHRWYQDAIEFCEYYDQNCFDPDYKSETLEYFRPMLKSIFGRKPRFSEAGT